MTNGLRDFVNITYLIWVDNMVFNQKCYNRKFHNNNLGKTLFVHITRTVINIIYDYYKTFNKLMSYLTRENHQNNFKSHKHIFSHRRELFPWLTWKKATLYLPLILKITYRFAHITQTISAAIIRSLTHNLPMFLPTRHTFSTAMQFQNSTFFQIN